MLMRVWEEKTKSAISTEIIHRLAEESLKHKKFKYTSEDIEEITILALSIPTEVADKLRARSKE